MSDRELPFPELLRKLLRYEPETGRLFWRERCDSMFKSVADANRWNTRYAGKEAFCNYSADGYKTGKVCSSKQKAHRVVWAVMTGAWPREEIDHINGDPSDNRWENLREVSSGQNSQNTAMSVRNKSGAVGVFWNTYHGKWAAKIKAEGKQIHLGYFDDFDKAVAARKLANNAYGFSGNHGHRKSAAMIAAAPDALETKP
jgi:hypothetical protein